MTPLLILLLVLRDPTFWEERFPIITVDASTPGGTSQWRRLFLFGSPIFKGYVSFRECMGVTVGTSTT